MGRVSESPVVRWWQNRRERLTNQIRRGKKTPVLLLGVAALLVAAAGAFVLWVLQEARGGTGMATGEAFWGSLIRTLDPGQIGLGQIGDELNGEREVPWGVAAVGLVMTVLGIVLAGSVISIITSNVERIVESGRTGRDPAPSFDGFDGRRPRRPFYVILGWSDSVPRILVELVNSVNGTELPQVLVVAPEPVDSMERAAEEAFEREAERRALLKRRPWAIQPGRRMWRWLRFRTGDPSTSEDLQLLSAIERATSVLVVWPNRPSGSQDGPSSDEERMAYVTRTVFAITSVLASAPEKSGSSHVELRVVAEVESTSPAVRSLSEQLAQAFSSDAAQSPGRPVDLRLLGGHDIQAHVAALVVRSAGLSAVYEELFDFKDCEFRVVPVSPESLRSIPAGTVSFGELVLSASAPVVGWTSASDRSVSWCRPEVRVLPDWTDEVDVDDLRPGPDGALPAVSLVTIQRAAVDVHLGPIPSEVPAAPNTVTMGAQRDDDPEDVVVVGWNDRGPELVRALAARLASESSIFILDDRLAERLSDDPSPLDEIPAVVQVARRPDDLRGWLRNAEERSGRIEHAVLLAGDDVSDAISDARVLLEQRLMHPPNQDGIPETTVVELKQRRSRRLATQHASHDLIVGNELVDLVLAQYLVDGVVGSVIERVLDASPDLLELIEVALVDLPAPGQSSPNEVAGSATTFGELRRHFMGQGQLFLGLRVLDRSTREAGEGWRTRRPDLYLDPGDDWGRHVDGSSGRVLEWTTDSSGGGYWALDVTREGRGRNVLAALDVVVMQKVPARS